MDSQREIEEDVNLFDVVDEQEYVDESDVEVSGMDRELDFESGSLDGYEEMVETEAGEEEDEEPESAE